MKEKTMRPLSMIKPFKILFIGMIIISLASCDSTLQTNLESVESAINNKINPPKAYKAPDYIYSSKTNNLKGFRNYELGSDISLYPKLVLVGKGNLDLDDELVYVDPTGEDRIGDIKIKNLEYEFYRGKLESISYFVSPENVDRLLYGYEDLFGKGQVIGAVDIATWENQENRLTIGRHAKTNDLCVRYTSKTLSEQAFSEFSAASTKEMVERDNKVLKDLQ